MFLTSEVCCVAADTAPRHGVLCLFAFVFCSINECCYGIHIFSNYYLALLISFLLKG